MRRSRSGESSTTGKETPPSRTDAQIDGEDPIKSLCQSLRHVLVEELGRDSTVALRTEPPEAVEKLHSGFSHSDLYLQTSKWFPDSMTLLSWDGAAAEATASDASALSPAEAQRLSSLMKMDKLVAIEKAVVVERPQSKTKKQKAGREERKKTAGRGWYDLPLQEPDDQLKQELQVLRLRSFADPKKFYKKGDRALPQHFEVGRVIASATDFYSKDRPGKAKKGSKLGFVDELLEDQQYRKYAKRKYREIQEKRSGGGRRRKRVKI